MDKKMPGGQGPRLVMRGSEEKWEVVIERASELCDRVGPDLVAAFLKCFEGVNRVHSLEQLMYLNDQALDKDSPAGQRNLRVLVFLLGSTMYELGEALQQLCSAKVVDKMKDQSAWEPVNKLRGKWQGDGRLAQLRKTFGFHLGKPEEYRAGLLARLKESDEQVFEHSGGSKRHDGDFTLPLNALFAGANINDEWVEAVFRITQEDHEALPDQLHAVWVEVLRTAGVPIESE